MQRKIRLAQISKRMLFLTSFRFIRKYIRFSQLELVEIYINYAMVKTGNESQHYDTKGKKKSRTYIHNVELVEG